jgi:hypothetical protein
MVYFMIQKFKSKFMILEAQIYSIPLTEYKNIVLFVSFLEKSFLYWNVECIKN